MTLYRDPLLIYSARPRAEHMASSSIFIQAEYWAKFIEACKGGMIKWLTSYYGSPTIIALGFNIFF